MKTTLSSLLLAITLVLGGCASVDSRINQNKAVFNEWSPEVQATIRAGRVDLGFTPKQVKVALGEPDRIFTRTTEEGTAEIWAYYDKKPKFSLGLGVSSGGYGSGVGGGVAYDRHDERFEDAVRVVLMQGKVTAVEMKKAK
jgi:hypothetical protein|uniref:hypothetical protein n=1 Tax=Cephaloticoccus sp. TaxID=1985742 RepID=UPI00404914AB